MRNDFAGFLAGLVFSIGLCVSGMINPAKVLAFLDVLGAWDPSLAFVMAGAVAVTALGYRLVLRQPHPMLAGQFHVPTRRDIDGRLLAGAAVFGAGWGLVGFCPGPAVAALSTGSTKAIAFLVAMLLGMAIGRYLTTIWPSRAFAG